MADLDLALRLRAEGFDAAASEVERLARAADSLGDEARAAAGDAAALGQAAAAAASGADRAEGEVSGLGRAAAAAGESLEDAAREAGSLGQAANAGAAGAARAESALGSLAGTARGLLATLGGLVGAIGLVELARMADTYAGVQARVQQVADSTEDYARRLAEVRQVAQATNTDLSATATLYGTLARVLTDLGTSAADAAALTTTINQALRLGGADAAANAAAVTQLSQALGSGVLRGDEFNSVMEQSPRLARALAESLGVTVGELRALAEQGELTAQTVIEALTSQSGRIAEEFAAMPARFEDALTRLRNAVTVTVGDLASASNAAGLFAAGLDVLRLAVEVLAALLTPFAVVLGALPAPLVATTAAALALAAAWGPLTAAATALGAAVAALVAGGFARLVALWGTAASAAGVLTAALRALWAAMLANPVTALAVGITALVTAFIAWREEVAETIAAANALAASTRAQITEIERLRAVMATTASGSEQYNAAAARLAELVPGLNVQLDAQGRWLAYVGEHYAENTAALEDYLAELRQIETNSITTELVAQAAATRQSTAALDLHVQGMRNWYGANEANRSAVQSMIVALATWSGRMREDTATAAELAAQQREAAKAFELSALKALNAQGSIDGVATAMRAAGASAAEVDLVVAALERLTNASDASVAGLSKTGRAIADAGRQGAAALGPAIEATKTGITQLDAAIVTHQRTLSAAQDQEAAGWRALAETARGTYDDAIAEAERYAAARAAAITSAGLSERERAQALVDIERQAAQDKLAALRQYQGEALRLIDAEGARRLEIARRSGGDLRAVELGILNAKRDTLRSIESDYRRHIDALNAEARRHLGEVVRIEDEIRMLRMSTEDRIRELERQGMSEYEAYQDRKRQAAEKAAEAERALSEGNFELARDLAKQSADLWSQNARAVTDGDREIISTKTAVRDSVKGVGDAAKIEERALAAMADASRDQAATLQASADDARADIQAVTAEVMNLEHALDQEATLTLALNRDQVDAALADLETTLADRAYLVNVQADLESLASQLEEAQSRITAEPWRIPALLEVADQALDDLQQRLGAMDAIAPEVTLDVTQALDRIGDIQRALDGIDNTESTHRIQSNHDQVANEIRSRLNGMTTYGTHYIRTVQQNAAGGPIARFAAGGLAGFPVPTWDRVPGSGNTDSVPAALEPGSYVLRKRATAYYGRLLDVLRLAGGGRVPAMLMPGEALFRPGAVAHWGQGLFHALNRLQIPRDALALALGGLAGPVRRFAAGGAVSAAPVAGASARPDVIEIRLSLGARDVRLSGSRDQAQALASALRDLQRGLG